jgi:hypothetical protein
MSFEDGVVEWGPRRTSRVRIASQLEHATAGSFDVSVDLPRGCFRTDERVTAVVARLFAALIKMAINRKRAARKAVVVKRRVWLPGRPWARLCVPRAAFNAVRQAYAKGGAREDIRRRAMLWSCQLVGARINDFVRTPPRAGGMQRRLLTTCLPSAFLAAQELVNLAAQANVNLVQVQSLAQLRAQAEELFPETLLDLGFEVEGPKGLRAGYVAFVRRVRRRIKEIWKQDDALKAYVGRRPEAEYDALIVALVHRAFQGAWEVAGHPGLLTDGRPPVEWLRKYLYGSVRRQRALLRRLRENHPGEYLGQLLAWGRDFLTIPGRAARSLGLRV